MSMGGHHLKHHDSGVSTMTWLSRLLPQSPNFQRIADYNHGHRDHKGRRRRLANLESLENRTLLAGQVLLSQVGSVLTVTLDKFSDHVNINEAGNNKVVT